MTVRNLLAALSVGAVGVAPAALPSGPQPVVASPVAAAVFERAATASTCGVQAVDLAAIQQQESPSAVLQPDGTVTNPDGTPVRGDLDAGYSRGPFQFNDAAGTWARYGHGDPDRLDDAAAATAAMLCADGYGVDRRTAIRSHNGSGPAAELYADTVLARASTITLPAVSGASSGGLVEAGLAGRIADRVALRAVNGWKRLVGWTGRNAPNAAPTMLAADRQVDQLTGMNTSDMSTSHTNVSATNGLVCPVVNPRVIDGWGSPRSGGRTHQGVDIAGEIGSPVAAPFAGTVTQTVDVEADGGLGGLAVWVRADSGPYAGVEVYLAHLQTVTSHTGQHVVQGQQVGRLGTTGNAAGTASPHVHAQWAPDGGAPVPATPLEQACGGLQP